MFLIMQNCFLITHFAFVKLRFLTVMVPLGYPEVDAVKLAAHASGPSSSRAHRGDPRLLSGCTQSDSGRGLHSQVPHTTHTLILSPAKKKDTHFYLPKSFGLGQIPNLQSQDYSEG